MSNRALTAYTANPNTPETDRFRTVMHVVEYIENGEEKKVMIYAECPLDAMEKVNTRLLKKAKESGHV